MRTSGDSLRHNIEQAAMDTAANDGHRHDVWT